MTTAPMGGPGYCLDDKGRILHYKLTDYGREGPRRTSWFIDDVRKEHRSLSTLVNSLTKIGFQAERMSEPLPSQEAIKINQELIKKFISRVFRLSEPVKK